jgi:diacylglycerol kinase family enzyme
MGTARAFADFFDIDKDTIESALEMLEADEEIDHIEDQGQKRYYRLHSSAGGTVIDDE